MLSKRQLLKQKKRIALQVICTLNLQFQESNFTSYKISMSPSVSSVSMSPSVLCVDN